MSALAFSVVLSLVSAVAYAAGAIVQEQVAVSSPAGEYAPLRRPGWWAAVALNGSGGLLHVVALAYGPLSLVQPLGALTIVFALPMAALFVGRRAGATAWRGAIMATVGLAGLLSLVGAADAQSLSTAERVTVALVTAAAVVSLMIAGRAAHRHPAVRAMILATASGIAFGMSSVFTKTVAVDWADGVSVSDVPSLAVIAVLATAGMLLSQASYRGAGLAAPLATLTVVNPVVAAAVGITMFGETFRYGTTGTVLALSSGVVAAGGLILLTTERLRTAQAQPAHPEGAVAAAVAAAPGTEVFAGTPHATAGRSDTVVIPGPPVVPLPDDARTDAARLLDDVRLDGVPWDEAQLNDTMRLEEARLGGALLGEARRDGVPLAHASAETEGGDGRLVPTAAPAGAGGDPYEETPSDPDASPSFHTPVYGGLYIPMPVVDRHRVRVKS